MDGYPDWPALVIKASDKQYQVIPFGGFSKQIVVKNTGQKDVRGDARYLTLKHAGVRSEHAALFNKAMEDFYEFEDDDPDSEMPTVTSSMVALSEAASPSPMAVSKSDSTKQSNTKLADVKVGDLILARWLKQGPHSPYHPARVLQIKNGKFQIEYWDTVKTWAARKTFFVPDDEQFFNVAIDQSVKDFMEPGQQYENADMKAAVESLRDHLTLIVNGEAQPEYLQRHNDFSNGGRSKLALMQNSGRGPFNPTEYAYIQRCIMSLGFEQSGMTWNSYVNSVLTPECILQLIMMDSGVSYQEAFSVMMQPDWISKVLYLASSKL